MIKNVPDLWLSDFPRRTAGEQADSHKYDYGHVLVYGAPELTGATRLAAEACARMGAGLVSVLSCSARADVFRVALPAHILVRDDLLWNDARVTARLYGCGGLVDGLRISLNRPVVLDAGALDALPEGLDARAVLTPHEGEFARVFPDIEGTRGERALLAARRSGAVVVLKGAGTVVAHPDGRVAVNEHDTPYLASAGTGDVLAGMIVGLLGQGVPSFEAACAAVWMHGECGLQAGCGLVASDFSALIPKVLKEVLGFC